METKQYKMLINVILLLISLTSSVKLIDPESNNGLWNDDFACDNTGNTGWTNCLKTTDNNAKQYHGIFTDIDDTSTTTSTTILSRIFKCLKYSTVYAQYTVAMDCNTETNQDDGVTVSATSGISGTIPKLDKNAAISSTESTIPISVLGTHATCTSSAPWEVATSSKTELGIIGPGRTFQLDWAIETTHNNDGIVITNIQIWCEKHPTQNPTIDPTIDPTYDPTKDPTPDPTDNPTTDPTPDPTHDPTPDPTDDPTTDPTPDPTTDPTVDPTHSPTYDPTYEPTQDPTYDPIGNVTTIWSTSEDTRFIHDPYSKFVLSLTMKLELLKSLYKVRWYFIDVDEYTGGNWTEIIIEKYKNINIYTSQIIDEYKLLELGFNTSDLVYISVLEIAAIRIINSGYCYNTTIAKTHILQPGKQYKFKLRIVADSIINDRYDEYFDSEILDISTNQFAKDGTCIVQLLNPKEAGKARLLDRFYFDCFNWVDPDSIDRNFTLKFNGLMNDVLINNALLSEQWTEASQDIIGMIGTKALKIKTLIRDDLGAITCYDINIDESFPDAELTDEEILEAIKRVIRENKLGQDNSIAVALDTILEGLLFIGYANQDVLQIIMDLIIKNVVATSYATNISETSSGRVISEATMVKGLLSEDSLIFSDSASQLVDEYLPSLFSAIDLQIIDKPAIQLDNSIGDSLGAIGIKSLDLSGRLENFMARDLSQFDIDTNNVLESFTEFGAYSGHVVLAQSYPGSVFEYQDPEGQRKIITQKFDPNATNNAAGTICGFAGSNIQIPNGITDSFFDCSFVDQKNASFQSKKGKDECKIISPKAQKQNNVLSNTLTINLYNGDTFNSVFDTRRRRTRRRRMQDDLLQLQSSHLENTEILDTCNPYWIKIDLTQNSDGKFSDSGLDNSYSLGANTQYPSCTFWNSNCKNWDTSNCFVYNYTNEYVLCACQHLTTFNVKADDFKPQANMVTIYDFRELTKDNLMTYPVVWITLSVIAVLFIFICLIFPGVHKDNRSPLAYKDVIFRVVRDMKTKYYLPSTTTNVFNEMYDKKHDHYGYGLIKTIRTNICILQLRLYKIYLYDMHSLLSVFQHSEGTNFSKRERLAAFFLYLCTIMVSSAAFYGVEQQKFGDITASFLISLWSMIPAFIVKKSFIKAKPKIADFTIKIIDVDYDKVVSTDLSQLPLKEEEIDRYDDDRFSVRVEGFRKPILKDTIENEIREFGEIKNIRVANTRSYVYAIFKEKEDAKKCIKKLNGMKYPKKAKAYEQKKLGAIKVARIEAMAYIFQVDEQELRELWGNQHKDEVTEKDIKRYTEIWTHISQCNGNFYGVDKYMVTECIRILWKVKDKTFHIAFLDYIRNKLLTKDQTWPHFMKYFGWLFLLLWSSGCALLAIVYGISFDIKYDTAQASNFNAMGYNEQCWDMNPQLVINEQLTEIFIDDSINNLNNNYGTHIGDSSAWLLSLLESTLISIFFWQPLTIYFITWLMIWLFSWNLPVLLKPKILLQLIKKIYGIVPQNAEKTVKKEIELAAVDDKKNNKKKIKEYDSVLSLSQTPSTPASPTSITSPTSLISPTLPQLSVIHDTNVIPSGETKKQKNLTKKKRKNTEPVSQSKTQNVNKKKKKNTTSIIEEKKQNLSTKKKRSKSMALKKNKDEKLSDINMDDKKEKDSISVKKNKKKNRKNTAIVDSKKQNLDSVKKRSKSIALKTNKPEKPPQILVENKKQNKKKKTINSKRTRSKTITDSKKLRKSKSPTARAKSPTGAGTPRSNRKISIKIVNKHGQQKFAGVATTPSDATPTSPNTQNAPNMHKKRAMTLNDLPKHLDLSLASNMVTEMHTPTNEEIVQFKKGGTRVIEKVHKEVDDSVVEMDKRGFLVTVHHQAEQEEKNEYEKYNPFDFGYGSDKYVKIVTKEQRPFDVFSFFGAEVFFLDVVKSDDGKNLDIKGYCVNEWRGDGEIIIEEQKKKRNAWDKVVAWQ